MNRQSFKACLLEFLKVSGEGLGCVVSEEQAGHGGHEIEAKEAHVDE
tara:strand:+ start:792 stop:932 length:141 start_codon:yes stop_codon:yes gene_type:complete